MSTHIPTLFDDEDFLEPDSKKESQAKEKEEAVSTDDKRPITDDQSGVSDIPTAAMNMKNALVENEVNKLEADVEIDDFEDASIDESAPVPNVKIAFEAPEHDDDDVDFEKEISVAAIKNEPVEDLDSLITQEAISQDYLSYSESKNANKSEAESKGISEVDKMEAEPEPEEAVQERESVDVDEDGKVEEAVEEHIEVENEKLSEGTAEAEPEPEDAVKEQESVDVDDDGKVEETVEEHVEMENEKLSEGAAEAEPEREEAVQERESVDVDEDGKVEETVEEHVEVENEKLSEGAAEAVPEPEEAVQEPESVDVDEDGKIEEAAEEHIEKENKELEEGSEEEPTNFGKSESFQFIENDTPKKSKVEKVGEETSEEKNSDDVSTENLPEFNLENRYYSIGEVATLFGVNISHIRFWTNEFKMKVRTTRKGDRLYNPDDIAKLRLIHHLVKENKHTIKGAKEKLKQNTSAVHAQVDLREKLEFLKSKLEMIKRNL